MQYSGGAKVNNGEITMGCLSEYEANTDRFRHGKQTYKDLINKLQQDHGQKSLLVATEALKYQSLLDIKEEIWPTQE